MVINLNAKHSKRSTTIYTMDMVKQMTLSELLEAIKIDILLTVDIALLFVFHEGDSLLAVEE